jgi:hypothetical protein
MAHKNYLGVCCDCQQQGVPVTPLRYISNEENEFAQDQGGDLPTNPLMWECDPHDAFGEPCNNGRNTTPQAVYEKSRNPGK